MSSRHLIVKLQCTEAAEQEVMDTLKWEAGESRKEAGCQRFDIVKDSKDERTYQLYEVYADKAAADAHLETEHFKAIWALKEAGKFDIISMDEADAFDI